MIIATLNVFWTLIRVISKDFFFLNSGKSTRIKSGLNFSKCVVDRDYIWLWHNVS